MTPLSAVEVVSPLCFQLSLGVIDSLPASPTPWQLPRFVSVVMMFSDVLKVSYYANLGFTSVLKSVSELNQQ